MPWNPLTPGSTSQGDNQYAAPSGDLDFGAPFVLTSEDGTKFRLIVGDDGVLDTEAI